MYYLVRIRWPRDPVWRYYTGIHPFWSEKDTDGVRLTLVGIISVVAVWVDMIADMDIMRVEVDEERPI